MTTPTEPSFEERLLDGFAATWAAWPEATVPVAYDADPTHAYPTSASDPIGIYLDRWPEVPEGSISITDYTVTDDPSLSDSVIGVQVMVKHRDLAVVKAVVSDLFNLFHGRQRGMLGSVTLVSALRTSGTNAGQDSNERQGRIENYYLTVHRPSANRL